MSALLAALGVGIISYIVLVMVFPKAVPENEGDATRQALDRIYEENRTDALEQRNVLRDNLQEEAALVRLLFGSNLLQPMYEAAVEAGYQKSLEQVLLVMFAIALATGVAGFLFAGMGLEAVFLGLICGYLLPYRHCKKRVKKRNFAFIDQFPDALDIIVRSVRSGFPLSVALQMLAESAESPVREEFRQVVDDIALGRTLQQALARLAVRINEPDIRFFVVVLSVQQETGGNLAEIIGNLSNIIRKRKQLRYKIRAMTSEGRATGWVLGSLPVLVFVALFFMQRDYIAVFWQVHQGQMLLAAIAALIGTCAFVIKHMVDMEV